MGFLDVLKGIGKVGLGFATGGPVGAIGAGLGAFSQGEAKNRGEKLGGQFDLESVLMARDRDLQQRQMAREQEGRESGGDAFRRLMAAQRVLSPGPRPQLSTYSVAPRIASDAERTGADAMTQEVMARLQSGNPIPEQTMRPLAVDPKLMDPGLLERITGYGSLGLGAWDALRKPPVINNSSGNSLAKLLSVYGAPRV